MDRKKWCIQVPLYMKLIPSHFFRFWLVRTWDTSFSVFGSKIRVIKKNDPFINRSLSRSLSDADSSVNMIHYSGRYLEFFISCELVWTCLHTVRSKSEKRSFSVKVRFEVWKPQQVSFEDHWTESNHRIWNDHTIPSIGLGQIGLEGSNGVENDGLRSKKLTGSLMKNATFFGKNPHSKQFTREKMLQQDSPI